MRIIGLIALLLLAGCENPNQFNLVCQLPTQPSVDPKLTQIGYRVDLKAMRWCNDDGPGKEGCSQTDEIIKVTPERLTLSTGSVSIEINRENGAYYSDLMGLIVNGQCVKKPFTGFPAKRF